MSVDTTQLFPELEADSLHSDSGRSRRFLIILMFTAVIALLFWAAMTTLTGVTRATGMVVPSMQNQIVQHLEGGIVSQIRVKQGDQVEQGQVLLSIEDSQAKSTLQQTLTQISAKTAAIARIEAELADQDVIDFPDTLTDRAILQNEQSLFEQHRRQRHDRGNEPVAGTEIIGEASYRGPHARGTPLAARRSTKSLVSRIMRRSCDRCGGR